MQIEECEVKENPNFYHYSRDIPRFGTIGFEPNLPPFLLNSAAKRTDLLQHVPFSGKLLLLSPRAKAVILNLHTDEVEWFSAMIRHRQQRIGYYAAYLPNLRQELIDWPVSSFAIVSRKEYSYEGGVMQPIEIEEISLRSYEEYLQILRSLRETPHTIRMKFGYLNQQQSQ